MEALQSAGEKLAWMPKPASSCLPDPQGSFAMIAKRDDSQPSFAKSTSPGGTTAAAIKAFEDGGFRDLVLKAMCAARDGARAREIVKIKVGLQPKASKAALSAGKMAPQSQGERAARRWRRQSGADRSPKRSLQRAKSRLSICAALVQEQDDRNSYQ